MGGRPSICVHRALGVAYVPLSEYFKGDGRKVMADFVKRYGKVRGKQLFYATASKRGLAPKKKVKRKAK